VTHCASISASLLFLGATVAEYEMDEQITPRACAADVAFREARPLSNVAPKCLEKLISCCAARKLPFPA